ncbi:hypothetical protein HGRIS_004523 [Hohenbuehelia grisea]|uniref:F-box domain-containing protein n=1 Tax=Hohenbuehelia grisea TaxID=104357 RepID=A0ABR3JCY2_9AGAR
MDSGSLLTLMDRNKIDLELAKYRGITLQLLKRRNDLSPINKVPAEILSSIFELLAANTFWDRESDTKWMQVVGVCCRWREVALACPSLWRYFVGNLPPEWLAEKLRLSRSAPLHISIPAFRRRQLSLANAPDTLPCLLDQASRIQELSIISVDKPSLRSAIALLPTMTKIRVFQLIIVSTEALELSEDHINLELSQLRRLDLVNVKASWGSWLLPNLRELTLSGSQILPMLSTIASLTRLEVLELNDALDLSQTPPSPSTSIPALALSFPCLKHLKISQDYIPGVSLIDHIISVPLPALISLELAYHSIPPSAASDFDAILEISIRVLLRHPGPFNVFVDNSEHGISCGVSYSPRHREHDTNTSQGDPEILSIMLECLEGAHHFTRDLILGIPSGKIHTLTVMQAPARGTMESTAPLLTQQEWLDVFRKQPNITQLHVDEFDGFLEALLASEGFTGPAITTSVKPNPADQLVVKPVQDQVLLKLTKLTLERCFFDYTGSRQVEQGTMFRGLLLFLQTRLKMGRPLKTLSLDECIHITPTAVTAFNRLDGLDVVWDQCENFTSDDSFDDGFDEEEEDEDE